MKAFCWIIWLAVCLSPFIIEIDTIEDKIAFVCLFLVTGGIVAAVEDTPDPTK